MSYTAPRGASARVTITRVSGVSFWVVSEGTAGALGSQARARRRYGTFFKLDMPQMNFMGAITTQGNTTVNGNVTVNGNDAAPANWSGCGPTAPGVAGAAISPTTTATINGSVSLSGSPPVLTTDRKSTRLNSSHDQISYAVFCLKKKKRNRPDAPKQQNGAYSNDGTAADEGGNSADGPRTYLVAASGSAEDRETHGHVVEVRHAR